MHKQNRISFGMGARLTDTETDKIKTASIGWKTLKKTTKEKQKVLWGNKMEKVAGLDRAIKSRLKSPTKFENNTLILL